jgi:hypothetical protein
VGNVYVDVAYLAEDQFRKAFRNHWVPDEVGKVLALDSPYRSAR